MVYFRLYTDPAGETHFENLAITDALVDYAPPAPPLYATIFNTATAYGFLRLPPGWEGDWHPVARRQVHVYLSGEIEAQVSDGEVRRASPGTVVLVEDTTGKGHVSRVVSPTDVTIAVVIIPEAVS